MSRSLVVLPDDSAKPIVDAIKHAAKSLRIKMFVFTDPFFNFADTLKILVKFGCIVLAKPAFQIRGALHHGVEHAALLRQQRLLFFRRRCVLGKESVIGLDWGVLAADSGHLRPKFRLYGVIPQ